MKIAVLGYIVRGPLGGLAWHHFQYVLGLKALGHDVLFLEDSDDFAGCYNPDTSAVTENPDYGLRFIKELFDAFSLQENWAYFDAHTNNWFGLSKQKVVAFCSEADLVLNVSGVNPLRDWWINIPRRVFIDTDPGFTQIRHLTEPFANALVLQHTHHFSFGENIGKTNCSIPDDGFHWKATRQPVYLDAWKVAPSRFSTKWTTVMQWDSYKIREYQNRIFGMKSMSFKDFIDLPKSISTETFELAIGSASAPIDELKNKGWNIISSLTPTSTPWTYQQYIKQSKGEWSVAKHGYVVSNSGWFSERSACYLASGKPVAVQNTGFSQVIETGRGLFAFSSLSEAIAVIDEINSDYPTHCRYARDITEEYFGSDKVLSCILNLVS